MLTRFSSLLLCMTIIFSTTSAIAAIDKNAIKAFSSVDDFFVKQYSAENKRIGTTTFPVLVVNGFTYQFYTAAGKVQTFNGLVSPFNELKAVSHIGPGLYSIINTAWQEPSNPAWKVALKIYQQRIEDAIKAAPKINWSNAAWPNDADKVRAFMVDSLKMADQFISESLAKGSVSLADYQTFSEHYMHTMIATMYLADLGNTSAIIHQLQKWKDAVGEEQWDQMYVLVMGSKGRTTSELTLETSTVAITVSGLMKPELVKNHIIIMPMATKLPEAQGALGAIINAKRMAAATFVSQRSKEATGIYSALNTSDVPLAKNNVHRIVAKTITDQKMELPELQLLEKDKAYLK